MAGAMVLPFLASAGEAAGATGAGLAGAGAGAAATGAEMAGAGGLMSSLLGLPGAGMNDMAVGALPVANVAKGVTSRAADAPSREFLDYMDKGIRLGQLAGLGPSQEAPVQSQGQPQMPPAQIEGASGLAPQMPIVAAQPRYEPTALRLLDLTRRR